MILESDEDYYSVNVSNIVSKAILNKGVDRKGKDIELFGS